MATSLLCNIATCFTQSLSPCSEFHRKYDIFDDFVLQMMRYSSSSHFYTEEHYCEII